MASYIGPCSFACWHSSLLLLLSKGRVFSKGTLFVFPSKELLLMATKAAIPQLLNVTGLFSIFTVMLNLMHKWTSLQQAMCCIIYLCLEAISPFPLSFKWILEDGKPLHLSQKHLSFCEASVLSLVVGLENNICTLLPFNMSPLPLLPRQPHKISTP